MSEPTHLNSDALGTWQKAAAKSAPGGQVDALNWHTPEGLVVKPLYTAADLKDLAYTDTLPGFPPYLRGPQATMYAASTGSTAPFIVIDTLTLSSGIWSNRIFMSSTLSIATPALPTSPVTRGWSLS